jgi:NADPH-dependent 2,4-dienoyl-CoA reductase/sulfur reductase-like enzyme
MHEYADVVIIGAGPAGLAAARGAVESGAGKVIVLERDIRTGGILNQCIHEGFGLERFNTALTGPEYAQRELEAVKHEVTINCGTFVFEISPGRPNMVRAIEYGRLREISSPSIVLAMGCRERPAGAISLPGSRVAGIYTAGTAQRLMNLQNMRIGSRALIIGSGDIGLIMARRMRLEGAEVAAVTEINDYPGGLERNIRQCLYDFSIPLHLKTIVTDIRGRDRVTGATTASINRQEKSVFSCDTILLSVGLIPENELTRQAGAELDPATGGPVVNQHMMTTVDGLFACGNVLKVHDIADVASEEAQQAGYQAGLHAQQKGSVEKSTCRLRAGELIRFVTPQMLNPSEDAIVMLRPVSPLEHAVICVRDADGTVVHRSEAPRLHPSEMFTFTLPGGCMGNGDLEVYCEYHA